MTTAPQHDGISSVAQEAANPGRVRPPFVYLTAIILGVAIHLIAPVRFFPAKLAVPFGLGFVAVAIALFYSSVAKLRAAGTPLPGGQPTTTIVRTGPYRFTRNPIYVAFSLFQLGIAIWINSVWLLVTLAAAVTVIDSVVIAREERYLERKFGAQYLDYKKSVRRWV